MYIPRQFVETCVDELRRIILANSLGIIVTNGAAGIDANHVPFLLNEDEGRADLLIAHVARANTVWQDVKDGDDVVVIFRGVDGYISPNWYPGKQETHRRVPTWNYEVVHAHGTIHVHDDEKFVRHVVARLTRLHETPMPLPWKMADAPLDFIAEQLKNIVGIEVRVNRLEGKRKLNQHHRAEDRQGAICGLKANGNFGLAQAMKDS